MKKISKFMSFALLLLAGVASAVTIDGEKYWYCLEWTSNTTGEGDVILTQVPGSGDDGSASPHTESTTCFESWTAPTGESHKWKESSGANIGTLISNMMSSKQVNTFKLGSNIDFGGTTTSGSTTTCVETFNPLVITALTDFDGQNYEIRNMCIRGTASSGSTNYYGFIKSVGAEANLHNVKFVNPYVNVSAGTAEEFYVGVLAGNLTNVTIENVSVSGGSVIATSGGVKSYAGGVAGALTNVTLESISVSGLSISGASTAAGGVLGSGAVLSFSDISVSNTQLTGTTIPYGAFIGGFAGEIHDVTTGVTRGVKVSNTTISECNGTENNSSACGGMIGYVDWSDGKTTGSEKQLSFIRNELSGITISGNDGSYLGGLFGRAFNDQNDNIIFEIDSNEVNATISGGLFAAGLVANVYYYETNASSIYVRENTVTGSIENGYYVGGIVGSIASEKTLNVVVSGNSYEGDVTASSAVRMGGILGNLSTQGSVDINHNYNKGTISAGRNTIVGYIVGNIAENLSNRKIYSNYHYGSDSYPLGVGQIGGTAYDESSWKLGSAALFANIRNAVTGLTADGALNVYSYYDEDWAKTVDQENYSAMENQFTRRTFVPSPGAASGSYIKNGVVSDDDMKSGMLGGILNYIVASTQSLYSAEPSTYIYDKKWKQKEGFNDNLPYTGRNSFRAESVSKYAKVPVSAVTDADKAGTLNLVEDSSYTIQSSALKSSRNGYVLIGALDVDGKPNAALKSKTDAVIKYLQTNSWVEYSTEGYIATGTLQELRCYDVVHKYCDETNASCGNPEEDFDDVKNFDDVIALAPLPTTYCDSAERKSMVGMLVLKSSPFGFLGAEIGYSQLDNSFQVIYGGSSNKTISVTLPDGFKASYKAYGYEIDFTAASTAYLEKPGEGESQLEGMFDVPATNIAFDFVAPLGYKYAGSYDATYKAVTHYERAGDGGYLGPANVSYDTVAVTGTDFGRLRDLESYFRNIVAGGAIVFNLSDLNASSQIDFRNLYTAESLAIDGWYITEGFDAHGLFITPKTDPASYDVTFKLEENPTINPGSTIPLKYFIPSDFEFKKTYTYDPDQSPALPKIYGLAGSYPTISKGWMISNPEECVVTNEYNTSSQTRGDVNYCEGSRYRYTLSSNENFDLNLLSGAAAKQAISQTDGQNDAFSVVPLWYYDQSSTAKKITVASAETGDAVPKSYYPVSVTLSQTFSLNGQEVSVENSTDERGILYMYSDPSGTETPTFVFDVKYVVNPGFIVSSLSFQGNADAGTSDDNYDATTKKLTIPALKANGSSFVADYAVEYYNVTFDVTSIRDIDDVYVGKNFENPLSYWDITKATPMVYVREKGKNDYTVVEWNYQDAITPGYSDLVSASDAELASTKFVLKDSSKTDYMEFRGDYLQLDIFAVVDNQNTLATEETHFHGSLVLSQTFYDGTETRTIDHASSYTSAQHSIILPPPFEYEDTLQFKVSTKPDAGYSIVIKDYSPKPYGEEESYYGEETDDWKYDATNQTLNIRPRNYSASTAGPYFLIQYVLNDYNLKFTRPTTTENPYADVFVMGQEIQGPDAAGSVYTYDWSDETQTLHIGDWMTSNMLLDSNGCDVGWVSNSEKWPSDRNGDLGIQNDNADYFTFGDEDENLNVMTAKVRNDLGSCPEIGASYYTLTLETDGKGTVELVQEISSDFVIRHKFKPNSDGVLTMKVPHNVLYSGKTIRLKVVAVPNTEGDLVQELSLDYTFAGVDGRFVGKDGMEFDIDRDYDFHVSFTPKGPYYVKYDLEVPQTAADSAKIYFPEDAVAEESLVYDGESKALWAPFHTEKCFAGWSKKSSSETRDAGDAVLESFDDKALSELSTSAVSPTVLYPIWIDRGSNEDCPTLAENVEARSAVASGVVAGSEDDLVVTAVVGGSFELTQSFNEHVFRHPVTDLVQYIPFGEAEVGYVVQVQPIADEGYEYDANSLTVKLVNMYQVVYPVEYNSDKGGYTIADDNGGVVGDVGERDAIFYIAATFTGSVPVMSLNSDDLDGHFELTQGSSDAVTLGEAATRFTMGKTTTIKFVENYGVTVSKIIVKAKNADGEVINGENGSGEELTFSEASTTTYQFVSLVNDVEVASYELVAEATYDPMTVVFNENAGNASVYRSSAAWTGSASYTVNMTEANRTLPVVYRNDATLKGWSFAGVANGKVYTVFNADAVNEYKTAEASLAEGEKVKLNAIWDETTVPATYTVAKAAGEGQAMSLTCGSKTYDIGSGLKFPTAAYNTCTINYTAASGFSKNGFQLYDILGNTIGSSIAADAEITVNQNLVIKALVTATPYTVVLNANAPDGITLYYGKNWESEVGVDLGDNKALPLEGLYAVGYKLSGWIADGETAADAHTEFDAALKTLADALEAGVKLNLKAVWAAATVPTVVISSANVEGSAILSISQVVDASQTAPVVVPVDGLTIPKGNDDIALIVGCDAGTGYSLTNDFYTATGSDGKLIALSTSGKVATMTVAGNMAITAPVVADDYSFAFNVNTTDNLFYIADKVESGKYNVTMSEAERKFPEGFYRAGNCLAGWALTSTATTGFSEYNDLFIAAVDQYIAENEAVPTTLYAVWSGTSCEGDVTITVANAAAGSVKLTYNGKTYMVDAENSLKVPAVEGISFAVEPVLASGYINLTNAPLYYMQDAEKIILEGELDIYAGLGDVALNIPAVANAPLTVSFEVNAPAGETVFYGNTWKSLGSYTLDESAALPANLYANGYLLSGWKLSATATETYKNFDAAAMYDAATDGEVTLYGVWAASDTVTKATITSANLTEGTMTLSQVVEGSETFSAAVATAGVQVPLRKDIDLNVKFVPNTGYSINSKGFYTTTDANNKAEAIQFTTDGAKFTVAGSVKVTAPVVADDYSFAFNVNTTDELFYIADKVESGKYNVTLSEAERKFPEGFYRVGNCHAGWALTDTATTGFSEYNDLFIADVNKYIAANGSAPATLYAVWSGSSCGGDVTITVANAEAGSVKLTYNGKTYTVDAENSLKVPAVDGIKFVAKSTLNDGYVALYDDPMYYMNGTSKVNLTNDTLYISSSMTAVGITIPAVATDPVTVVFDVNAGDMNVFYGANWASSKEYLLTENEALPTNIYSATKKFNGWKLSATATTTYDKFNAADMYAAAVDGKVTLIADWTAGTVNTATITSANLVEGTMTLTQVVNDVVTFTETVGANGVVVPLSKDIELNVTFVPNTGYSLGNGFYTSTNASNKASALTFSGEGAKFNVAGDAKIAAPVVENVYQFAFETNASDTTKLFYAGEKVEYGSYTISENDGTAFPTNIYRNDACLSGWALTADGAAFTKFDADFVKAFDANESISLYAVWNAGCEQGHVTVVADGSEKGLITLSQTVGNKVNSFVVDGELVLPSAPLTFSVSYTVNPGYSAVTGAPINVVDGQEIIPLEGNVLTLDGQEKITLSIPATMDDAFEVVFSENTSEKVFYGNGWVRKGSFAVGGANNAFPAGLYRNDASFKGWAFTSRGNVTYRKYDSEFISALKAQKSLGNNVDTLYAIWNTFGNFETYTVSTAVSETGSFFIYQMVDGVAGEPIAVTSEGVKVPVSEDGLEFHVNYRVGQGYSLAENGYEKEIVVNKNKVLAANVIADPYQIVFNVNAEKDANVFYGRDWVSEKTYTVASEDDFSKAIYQSDKVLEGWSLYKDGSGDLYNSLTGELTEKLAQNVSNTLYAVWKESPVETYTVSFANTESGELKLAQVVDLDTVDFVVGEDGLKVPVVEGGFQFLVAFKAAAGFVYDELKDNLIVSDASGDSSAVKDELVVENDVVISIPLSAEDYKLVFNVNSDRKDVIYGDDWISGGIFSARSDASKKLPQVIYTADACVAGWSVGSDTTVYTMFDASLIDALNKSEVVEQGYVLKAQWKTSDACVASGAYDRLTLNAKNGTMEFLENRENGNIQFTVAHTFASDNTMLLPREFNGVSLTVHSVPDSSYVLENLTMVRSSDTTDAYEFSEGSALVYYLYDGVFTANFVKSNKTPLAIAGLNLEQAGNAIRLSFATSEFEVTRAVTARAYVMDASANVVAEKVFDVIEATPAEFQWNQFPFSVGEYTVVAELYDSIDTVYADTTFAVTNKIEVASEGAWQMLSMAAVDTSAIVWDDDPAFYWWDENDQSGEFWQYKAFKQGDEIVIDRGYWYSSLEGRALALNPNAESAKGDFAWTLENNNSGWNLVANPYGWNLNLYNDNKDKVCATDDDCEVKFYTYNTNTAEYEEAVVLKPFEAVWAKVEQNTSWNLKGEPSYASDIVSEMPEFADVDSTGAVAKRRSLAKANAINSWSLQAILSDNRGKRDSWNVLGVSSRPFVSEEPPEAQGDHVTLSVKDGKKALAKSFKAAADSYEWELSLRASSDRIGNLTLVGVDGLRSLGYHVFVTVEGKTVEMTEGENVRVALKSRETVATVRVTSGSFNVVAGMLDGLRMSQTVGKVHVGFNVDESLAGSRTVVDIVNLDGKVLATYSTKAQAGRNMATMDAPRSGLYMLRVRVASQQIAGKVMVK